ncbi:Flp family type IVb pilin [Ramlibacter sp. RBP-2]|uniref:Flp family type IVb pilin n=1 Tax=Ramlibacter lithotrophicus TaxID=2606681 RepID=A0A7X6I660_9BURK|nr:Flp family type IVb pilin [Ramlibacter lithotrophicus]NKE66038.1 Flp family type IVb pilin [Ramlibacter lithotrophicus]
MNQLFSSIRSFAIEEDGAQVIEYALIIAVVSIALILLLDNLIGTDFNTFIGRVGNCLRVANGCV